MAEQAYRMRILIVDDHSLLIEGLTALLESRGFDVVGSATNGREGVEKALLYEPDLVLMDIRMPDWDGLTATRAIKAQRPEIAIVMLTTSAEDEDLFEAIKSGATGYLLKSTRGAAFLEALQGLAEGTPPFSPGLATRLLREFAQLSARAENPHAKAQEPASSGVAPLTERQTEVLRLVASGLTYKEVGAKLVLSDHTVRYHMSEIMRLLHLENRSQVIAYAGKLELT
jgi:DNA-binding NarL/FixJ family response regulator